MDCAFGVLSKKLSPNRSSSLLSLEVSYFVLYIKFMILFFSCGYVVAPAPFAGKKTLSFPRHPAFALLLKTSVTARVYFLALPSVPLTYLPIFFTSKNLS